MKKIFTTVCILLGAYSFTHAQSTKLSAGKTEVGLGLGVSGAYLVQDAEHASSTGFAWGFTAHASAEYYLSDAWGIKIKASYDSKGWGDGIYNDPSKSTVVEGVYYPIKYVTVPITINWHFGPEKNWYVMGGPYAGFLLTATNDYTHEDMKKDFKSTEFGADLGLGLNVPLSDRLQLFFEFDGQLGFTNIQSGFTNTYLHNSPGSETRKSGFGVGLKFK